jgi:hypothetical protein
VNVCIADASVHFITDSVNWGSDPNYDIGTAVNTASSETDKVITGISPFGIWGALGSINGGESASVK